LDRQAWLPERCTQHFSHCCAIRCIVRSLIT
jgi:hypothetical protein